MTSYKIDLHCHTNHSHDCQTPVRQLVVAAKKAGLQAVAITDHDKVSANAEAMKIGKQIGIQVIPGVEISTEGGTHVVALFIDTYPENLEIQSVLDFIREQGGISILPHPFRSDTGLFYNHEKKGMFTDAEIDAIMKKVDLVELNNFKSQLRGEAWPIEILKKYGKNVVGSTDAHYQFEVGKSFTALELEDGQELTSDLLLTAARQIGYYPIEVTPAVKASVPLAHYQPPVSTVSRLKKIFPPGLIVAIGKLFYSWQNYGRRLEKQRRLDTLLQGMELRQTTLDQALKSL